MNDLVNFYTKWFLNYSFISSLTLVIITKMSMIYGNHISALLFTGFFLLIIAGANYWKCEKNKEDEITLLENTLKKKENYILPVIYLLAMIVKRGVLYHPILIIILEKLFPLILLIATYINVHLVRKKNC